MCAAAFDRVSVMARDEASAATAFVQRRASAQSGRAAVTLLGIGSGSMAGQILLPRGLGRWRGDSRRGEGEVGAGSGLVKRRRAPISFPRSSARRGRGRRRRRRRGGHPQGSSGAIPPRLAIAFRLGVCLAQLRLRGKATGETGAAARAASAWRRRKKQSEAG